MRGRGKGEYSRLRFHEFLPFFLTDLGGGTVMK